MALYFGTDGIRGQWGDVVICSQFFYQIGQALASWARSQQSCSHFLIGRDTRFSGPCLESALTAALLKHGVQVSTLGVVPTPLVAWRALQENAIGLAITASHNPAADNGIKVFNRQGEKISTEDEAWIEKTLAALPQIKDVSTMKSSPEWTNSGDRRAYEDFLCCMHEGLNGLSIVLDTANGATAYTAPAVMKRLGVSVLQHVGNQPDGKNINAGVGSEHTETLKQAIGGGNGVVGFAYDGDGDRMVALDEKGEQIDGDGLLGIFALYLLEHNLLKNKTVVVTVQSNSGLDKTLEQAGVHVLRSDVGDRNVLYKMKEVDGCFGGESSGHIIFRDLAPSGDGLLSSLQLLKILKQSRLPLSTLARWVKLYPQKTLNLKIKSKPPLYSLKHLPEEIFAIEKELQSEGRVLVRFSGTEPKIRLLVEGPNERYLSEALHKLELAVQKDLC